MTITEKLNLTAVAKIARDIIVPTFRDYRVVMGGVSGNSYFYEIECGRSPHRRPAVNLSGMT